MLSDPTVVRDAPEGIFLRCVYKLRKLFSRKKRTVLNQEIKQKLGDSRFSIICNNCLGGVFYHDAGRQFTSPTVNLAFDGKEFVCFLENIHDYLNASFEFIEQDYVPYPVGHLGDIEVRFVHFKSSEECVSAWERRKQRIDWDHIYIIATDADGLNSPDLLERFDKLPFRNKILFTSLNLPQYDWAITVK